MAETTHRTAVVIIPPAEAQEPIQAIRRRHDRQVRRWMPHVTLVYPFRPARELGATEPVLRRAVARVEPFALEIARFDSFRHGSGRHTLWLAPEPEAPVVELQARLTGAVPDCDHQQRYAGGFTPHLSVGQAGDDAEAARLLASLQERWQPLRFPVEDVVVIRRGRPPGDIFREVFRVPLGTPD